MAQAHMPSVEYGRGKLVDSSNYKKFFQTVELYYRGYPAPPPAGGVDPVVHYKSLHEVLTGFHELLKEACELPEGVGRAQVELTEMRDKVKVYSLGALCSAVVMASERRRIREDACEVFKKYRGECKNVKDMLEAIIVEPETQPSPQIPILIICYGSSTSVQRIIESTPYPYLSSTPAVHPATLVSLAEEAHHISTSVALYVSSNEEVISNAKTAAEVEAVYKGIVEAGRYSEGLRKLRGDNDLLPRPDEESWATEEATKAARICCGSWGALTVKYKGILEWSGMYDDKIRNKDGMTGLEELLGLKNEVMMKPKDMEEVLEGK